MAGLTPGHFIWVRSGAFPPIQLSNSLSQRSAARILCRGPGEARLPCAPRQVRGRWRARWRNHCSLCAAFPLENAGASRRAIAAFSFRRRAALFGGRLTTTVSQAPGRQPVVASRAEPRRRPSACLRSTPAGAASGSTIKTPLDDALTLSRTNRIIVVLGLKSRRIFCVVPGERQRGPGSILRSPLIVHGVWVRAGACTRAGEAGPGCGDDSRVERLRAAPQYEAVKLLPLICTI